MMIIIMIITSKIVLIVCICVLCMFFFFFLTSKGNNAFKASNGWRETFKARHPEVCTRVVEVSTVLFELYELETNLVSHVLLFNMMCCRIFTEPELGG